MSEAAILTAILAGLIVAVPILLFLDGCGWLWAWSRAERRHHDSE